MKSWKCSLKECKNYELLPALCLQCKQLFCKEHEKAKKHHCQEQAKFSKNKLILKSLQKEQKVIQETNRKSSNESSQKAKKENEIKSIQKKLLQFEVDSENESKLNKIASAQILKTVNTQNQKVSAFNTKFQSSRNIDKLFHKPCFSDLQNK